MSHIFFSDPTLFSRLQEFDAELAQETLNKGCPFCEGVLPRAHYPRKPRGIPEDHRQAFSFRFSFCCARCRRRSTSESLRFLGRKVYVGLMVVLASCCRGRIHAWFSRVSAHTGVSLRTLYCWRSFWRKTFPPPHSGKRPVGASCHSPIRKHFRCHCTSLLKDRARNKRWPVCAF